MLGREKESEFLLEEAEARRSLPDEHLVGRGGRTKPRPTRGEFSKAALRDLGPLDLGN